MENYLNFIASTNLKSLLGRGLVTDQIAAIFELVKNAYDADAKKVIITFHDILTESPWITIDDDGSGMSLEDVEKKWMVIGTDSKKDEMFSPIFQRPLNGDKGIGRFSVDRLGSALDLKCTKRDSKKQIQMHFDWSEFETNYKNVSDVKIPYIVKGVSEKETGVCLSITGLRDNWGKEKIKELIKNLRQFKSPFKNEDNFKMIIHAPEFGYNCYEIISENLGTISSLWVDIECKEDNSDLVYIVVYKDGIEYEEVFENKYNIGPIRTKVYSFNQGDKIRFKNRFFLRVREFGNIRLYRDEFRIHPYGEENNDWLDIDRRHAQGFARSFSSRDLIGYVQTYKEFNAELIPLTNRQGLVENEEYQKLRQFIIEYAIKTLERYYFHKFKVNKNETIEKSKINIDNSTRSLNTIAKQVSKYDEQLGLDIKKYVNSIKKEQDEQLKYVKDQEELTKVYSRIAQKETFLHQLIHQALLDVKDARTAIEQLEKREDFILTTKARTIFITLKESIHASMAKMLTVRDDVARIRHKMKLDLVIEIENCLKLMKPQFDEFDIQVQVDLERNITYYMDKSDLVAILNNLISNSIKSLREINDRKRKLKIEMRNANRFIVIKVQDNGVGINEMIRERIFDPFFTTTEKYGGFGLGLTIVDEMLKEYNGALELIDISEPGACFLAKLRS